MGKTYLFTSESVSSGHPDKIADQISDAVLDEFLRQDRDSKVACETFITDGLALVGGEAHSNAYVDIKNVAKSVIKSIGYTTKSCFDPDNFGLISTIHEQSSDIRQGVDREEGEQGAGDQGIMFGYACSETSSYMPATLVLSHVTLQVLEDLRKRGYTTAIYPDSKSQYTIEYDGETNKPLRIKTILVSTQHAEGVTVEALRSLIKNSVIPEVRKRLPELDYLFETEYELLVNPTGQFIIGGPKGDTGLTGRKIIVDTYGGRSPHGGGAFCVDKNTEYLSENGWKKISEYDGGKVAQWDNGEMTFVEPLVYHKHKAEKMYHIKTGQSLDMVLSENHDVVLETSKGNIIKKRVKDLFPDGSVMNGNSGSIPTYFKFKGGKGVDLTDDEIRLQCAFCADGTLEHNRIRVKKEYKTERLKALLESTKIPYTHKVYSDEYNYFMFKPKIESKSLAECFKNANLEQFKIIAEEVVLWDGDRKNVFRTTKKQDADFIQFVFMTVYGTAATIIEDDRIGEEYNGGYERKSISYEVRHCTYSKVALRRSEKYSKLKLEVSPFESEDGYMYCFTVPSSMIVLRRNNKVFITGNCGKDPSKVDRSAAYMARYLAKNIVAAGLAKECTVQLSYAIGMAEPLSVYVNTNGTGAIDDSLIANRILDRFDLRPSAIVKRFGLKNPIYLPTATYGHFGKEPYIKEGIKYFGWEELDSVEAFKIV